MNTIEKYYQEMEDVCQTCNTHRRRVIKKKTTNRIEVPKPPPPPKGRQIYRNTKGDLFFIYCLLSFFGVTLILIINKVIE